MKRSSRFSRAKGHLQSGTFLRALTNRFRWWLSPSSLRYLDRAKGVIHIGANVGQEREAYALSGVPVVWVEPVPETYDALVRNIAPYASQRAFQYLVTDRDDVAYPFNVASNGGGSSSILEMKLHRDIWPKVHFERTIVLDSVTLPTLLRREAIDAMDYDTLVMDTQGSELLILQGAVSLLPGFRFIRTEAADFEAYAGCCQIDDLSDFLSKHGFREAHRRAFAKREAGGAYFDVLFCRDD